MNLILLEDGEVGAGFETRVSGPRANHLLSVLKVQPGQTVRIGVLDGARGVATVRSVSDGAVELICALEPAAPPRPRIDLLLAVPRPKVMRRLWAQLAALGVSRVILTNAERVERAYFDTHMLTPECYRPLLIEGLQQARDTILPEVFIRRRFKPLVEDELDGLCGPALRLVGDPAASASVTGRVRRALDKDGSTRVLLAVGPEGGWNDFELTLLDAHGFERIGLGPRTLRTDTACVALLSLVQDALARSN